MTVIENLQPRVQYVYSTSSQVYNITFPYIERQYVKCMVKDQELTYNVHYQVPVFDPVSLETDELYLTLLITPTTNLNDGVTIEEGDLITIYRETPIDQQAEFPQTAKFSSQKITEALDKLTLQQQEQQDDISRCLKLAKNVPDDFETSLPSPVGKNYIRWSDDGSQLINYDLEADMNTFKQGVNSSINSFESSVNGTLSGFQTEINTFKQGVNTAIGSFEQEVNGTLSDFQNDIGDIKDIADGAAETANQAKGIANGAVTTANQAKGIAEGAAETAGQAKGIANGAVETANSASAKVDEFGEDIEQVIEAAEKINELEEAVETAVEAATDATTAATNATIAATTASTAATTATQKAQEATQAAASIVLNTYRVVYNTTTFSQVSTAIQEGKVPLLDMGNNKYGTLINKYTNTTRQMGIVIYFEVDFYVFCIPSDTKGKCTYAYLILGEEGDPDTWVSETLDITEQANWTQTDSTALDFIKNKPTIPAAQIQSDWSQSDNTALDYIKNKPSLTSFANTSLSNLTTNGINVLRRYQTEQSVAGVPSGNVTIDLSDTSYNMHRLIMTANTNITFNIPSGFGEANCHTYELYVDMSSTVYTLTFPSNLVWQNNETPDLSTVGRYFFAFRIIYDNAGMHLFGNLEGKW